MFTSNALETSVVVDILWTFQWYVYVRNHVRFEDKIYSKFQSHHIIHLLKSNCQRSPSHFNILSLLSDDEQLRKSKMCRWKLLLITYFKYLILRTAVFDTVVIIIDTVIRPQIFIKMVIKELICMITNFNFPIKIMLLIVIIFL